MKFGFAIRVYIVNLPKYLVILHALFPVPS